MKWAIITIILNYIIFVYSQSANICKQFDNYCKKCNDKNSAICSECFDGFLFNSKVGICQAQCNYNLVYDPQVKQCQAICKDQYYTKPTTNTCEKIIDCPQLQQIKHQYHEALIIIVREFDENLLVTVDQNLVAIIWDLTNNQLISEIISVLPQRVYDIWYCKEEQKMLFFGQQTYSIVDIIEAYVEITYKFGDDHFIFFDQFSEIVKYIDKPNELQLITNYHNNLGQNSIFLVDALSTLKIYNITLEEMNFVKTVVVSENKNNIAIKDNQGNIFIWSMKDSKGEKIYQNQGYLFVQYHMNDMVIGFDVFNLYAYSLETKKYQLLAIQNVNLYFFDSIFIPQKIRGGEGDLIVFTSSTQALLTEIQGISSKEKQLGLIKKFTSPIKCGIAVCNQSLKMILNIFPNQNGYFDYLIIFSSITQSISPNFVVYKLSNGEIEPTQLQQYNIIESGFMYFSKKQVYLITNQISTFQYNQLRTTQLANNQTIVFGIQQQPYHTFFSQSTLTSIPKQNSYNPDMIVVQYYGLKKLHFYSLETFSLRYIQEFDFDSFHIIENILFIQNASFYTFYKITHYGVVFIKQITSSGYVCSQVEKYDDFIFAKCRDWLYKISLLDFSNEYIVSSLNNSYRVTNNRLYLLLAIKKTVEIYGYDFKLIKGGFANPYSQNILISALKQYFFCYILQKQWTIHDLNFQIIKNLTPNTDPIVSDLIQQLVYFEDQQIILLIKDNQVRIYHIESKKVIKELNDNLFYWNASRVYLKKSSQVLIMFSLENDYMLSMLDTKLLEINFGQTFLNVINQNQQYFLFYIWPQYVNKFILHQTSENKILNMKFIRRTFKKLIMLIGNLKFYNLQFEFMKQIQSKLNMSQVQINFYTITIVNTYQLLFQNLNKVTGAINQNNQFVYNSRTSQITVTEIKFQDKTVPLLPTFNKDQIQDCDIQFYYAKNLLFQRCQMSINTSLIQIYDISQTIYLIFNNTFSLTKESQHIFLKDQPILYLQEITQLTKINYKTRDTTIYSYYSQSNLVIFEETKIIFYQQSLKTFKFVKMDSFDTDVCKIELKEDLQILDTSRNLDQTKVFLIYSQDNVMGLLIFDKTKCQYSKHISKYKITSFIPYFQSQNQIFLNTSQNFCVFNVYEKTFTNYYYLCTDIKILNFYLYCYNKNFTYIIIYSLLRYEILSYSSYSLLLYAYCIDSYCLELFAVNNNYILKCKRNYPETTFKLIDDFKFPFMVQDVWHYPQQNLLFLKNSFNILTIFEINTYDTLYSFHLEYDQNIKIIQFNNLNNNMVIQTENFQILYFDASLQIQRNVQSFLFDSPGYVFNNRVAQNYYVDTVQSLWIINEQLQKKLIQLDTLPTSFLFKSDGYFLINSGFNILLIKDTAILSSLRFDKNSIFFVQQQNFYAINDQGVSQIIINSIQKLESQLQLPLDKSEKILGILSFENMNGFVYFTINFILKFNSKEIKNYANPSLNIFNVEFQSTFQRFFRLDLTSFIVSFKDKQNLYIFSSSKNTFIEQNSFEFPYLINKVQSYNQYIFIITEVNKFLAIYEKIYLNNSSQEVDYQYQQVKTINLPCSSKNKLTINDIYLFIFCDLQINIYLNNKNQDGEAFPFFGIEYKSKIQEIILVEDTYVFLSNGQQIVIYTIEQNKYLSFLDEFKINIQKIKTIEYLKDSFSFKVTAFFQISIIQFTIFSQQQYACNINFDSHLKKGELQKKIWNLYNSQRIGVSSSNADMYCVINSKNQNLIKSLVFTDFIDSFKYAQIRFIETQDKNSELDFTQIAYKRFPDIIISSSHLTLPQQYIFSETQQNDNIFEGSQQEQVKLFATVTISDTIIQQDIDNFCFSFEDKKYVIIKNLTISGKLKLDRPLFKLKNIENIIILDLNIINISYSYIQSSIFDIQDSDKLAVENLVFQDSVDINISNIIQISQLSDLYVKNVTIKNIHQLKNNIDLRMFETKSVTEQYFEQISIFNCSQITFHICRAKLLLINVEFEIMLSNITHHSINAKKVYGEFPLLNINGNTYTILDSTFSEINSSSLHGSALYIQYVMEFLIQNSIFFNNSAIKGGAFFVDNAIQGKISECKFFNNTAVLKGGAIYQKEATITYSQCNIFNNTAKIGGGIFYYFGPPQIDMSIEMKDLLGYPNGNKYIEYCLKQILFQSYDNYAQAFGFNIGSFPWNLVVKNISLVSPIDSEFSFGIVQQNYYKINNFISGGKLQFITQLLDEESNSIKIKENLQEVQLSEEHDFALKDIRIEAVIDLGSVNTSLSNSIISTIQEYSEYDQNFNSTELKIIGLPGKKSFIYIYPNTIKERIQYKIGGKITLEINFRECQAGEIPILRGDVIECTQCQEGFYSLQVFENANVENKCMKCPQTATSCIKNIINLKQGYWRSSNFTDNILYCDMKPSNCLGSQEGNKNYCKKGLIGALCQTCDSYGQVWGQKYMRLKNLDCEECVEGSYAFLLPTFLLIGALVIYIIFAINTSLSQCKSQIQIKYLSNIGLISFGQSAYKYRTDFYVKQFIHYQQIQQMINIFDFNFPNFLSFIPETISKPLENIQYGFDCILNQINQDTLHIVYVRALWSLIIPVLFIIILGIIYLFMIAIRITKQSRFYISNGLLLILVYMQPSVLSDLIAAVSCQTIDGVSYIHKDSSYECYTKEHIKYSLSIILPGIIFWMFIIPISIFVKLRLISKQKQLQKIESYLKFGFLYQDYNIKFYYWEFIKSYKKIAIVIFYNFLFDYPISRLCVIGIILFLYLITLIKFEPYQMKIFNSVDNKVIISMLLILNMNIALHNKSNKISYQIFANLTAFYHNLIQFSLLITIISYAIMGWYFIKIYKFKKILKKYLPVLFSWLDTRQPTNPLRSYRNWRKVINKVRILIKIKKSNIQGISILDEDKTNCELTQQQKKNKQISNQLISYRIFSSPYITGTTQSPELKIENYQESLQKDTNQNYENIQQIQLSPNSSLSSFSLTNSYKQMEEKNQEIKTQNLQKKASKIIQKQTSQENQFFISESFFKQNKEYHELQKNPKNKKNVLFNLDQQTEKESDNNSIIQTFFQKIQQDITEKPLEKSDSSKSPLYENIDEQFETKSRIYLNEQSQIQPNDNINQQDIISPSNQILLKISDQNHLLSEKFELFNVKQEIIQFTSEDSI